MGPNTPTEPEARRAYRDDLDVCFIVRMPRCLRDQIEAHRAWMCARYHREGISLAAASRDLFARGLILSPPEKRARRALQKRGQLSLALGAPCNPSR